MSPTVSVGCRKTRRTEGKGQGTTPKVSWHPPPEHLPVLERSGLHQMHPWGLHVSRTGSPSSLKTQLPSGRGREQERAGCLLGTEAPAGPHLLTEAVATEP